MLNTNDRPFQSGGEAYAAFRPRYPAALANWLASLCADRTCAVDIGCGTGQLTALLADHFPNVIGLDASASQVAHVSPSFPNIRYLTGTAEATGLEDHSVDLIAAAQAAHWFDLPAFFKEARRIGVPGAVTALISYSVPILEGPVNTIFQRLYWQDLHRFWPPERAHVEANYRTLALEFAPLPAPQLVMDARLTHEVFTGYMRTWSAYAAAKRAGQAYLFDAAFHTLEHHWPVGEAITVVWPLTILAGRLTPASLGCEP